MRVFDSHNFRGVEVPLYQHSIAAVGECILYRVMYWQEHLRGVKISPMEVHNAVDNIGVLLRIYQSLNAALLELAYQGLMEETENAKPAS